MSAPIERTRRILAFDPGGTTGWSTWELPADRPLVNIDHGQWEGGLDGFVLNAQRVLRTFDPNVIVSESFVLDGRARIVDITPARIETAIDMIFGKWGAGLSVVWQRNVQKAQATDDFLKRNGLWFVGQEHARDSARHAIAYAKGRRHLATIEHYWPRR